MRVYDPCSGSGGMLILSKEYVEEHGGNPRNLRLYGQEYNGGVWSISKMNMLLHGIPDADMQNGDTLAEPLHIEGGELMRFDRVHHQSAVLAELHPRRHAVPGALPLRLVPRRAARRPT